MTRRGPDTREPDDVRRPLSLLGSRYGTGIVQANVLELLVSIARAQRDGAEATTPPLPRTPGR